MPFFRLRSYSQVRGERTSTASGGGLSWNTVPNDSARTTREIRDTVLEPADADADSGSTTRSLTGNSAQVIAFRDTPSLIRDYKTKSVQDRRVHTRLALGALRDRRPGHSADRTLRRADRPHHPPARPGQVRPGQAARGDRRRAGVPGRGTGAAAL